jgi:large subunit ribosomal protein L21
MSDTTTSAGPGPYAIVEASGQQFWLQPDRYVDLDRLAAEEGSTITLDSVLLVNGANGTTLGRPTIAAVGRRSASRATRPERHGLLG